MKIAVMGSILLIALAGAQAQAYSCTPDVLSVETAVVAKMGMPANQFQVVNYDFTPDAFDADGWISGWAEIEISPMQTMRVMGLTVRGVCHD